MRRERSGIGFPATSSAASSTASTAPAPAPAVLGGALVNREAAARALLALAAEHGCDATIVCAASPAQTGARPGGGRSIALEDALGAGAIAEAALRLGPSLQPP